MKNRVNNKMLYCLLLLRASGMQKDQILNKFNESEREKILVHMHNLPELSIDNVRSLKDRVDELIVPELLPETTVLTRERMQIDFIINNPTFAISVSSEAERYLNTLDKSALSSLNAYLDTSRVK